MTNFPEQLDTTFPQELRDILHIFAVRYDPSSRESRRRCLDEAQSKIIYALLSLPELEEEELKPWLEKQDPAGIRNLFRQAIKARLRGE